MHRVVDVLHDQRARNGNCIDPFAIRVENLERPDVFLLPQDGETLIVG